MYIYGIYMYIYIYIYWSKMTGKFEIYEVYPRKENLNISSTCITNNQRFDRLLNISRFIR